MKTYHKLPIDTYMLCVSMITMWTRYFLYNALGTPLGDKTMEIAQKVATDTAEELKKSAAALDGEIPGNLVYINLCSSCYI